LGGYAELVLLITQQILLVCLVAVLQVRPDQQGDPLFHVQALDTFFNLSTWVTVTVGAVVLFLLMRAVSGNRRRRRA